jgi:hypothetical protein
MSSVDGQPASPTRFQRIDALNMSYLGWTPSDGEVNINPFGVLTTPLALNSSTGISPFMNDIELPVVRGIAPATAGDHPALKASAQVVNRVTSATGQASVEVREIFFPFFFTAGIDDGTAQSFGKARLPISAVVVSSHRSSVDRMPRSSYGDATG